MTKLLFFFFTVFSFSQTHTITGVVFNEKELPLESANVIAKPLQEKAALKFAIADNKGRYRLELDGNVKYEITVSYIGFKEEVLVVEANSTIATHNFKLVSTGEELKEVVIKYEYKPIEIKKDTLTFNVKSFANGNERKMKEVLEKMPGVEVDKKGNVTVQGKKVTKMMVEGKSFFGGGSKLAVENIPADALDKIEVIDHFNEVGFMKKVSDSEDLAMNVKLKEDHKKFIFGDVTAAAEVANDNGFYLAHAGLFYYSPKTNVSYIGDANSIGKSTFTFEDLMRFEGGASSFLTGRKSLSNLYSFTNDNTDVVKNQSQFSALNFSFDASKKISISGFGIFSKVLLNSLNEYRNQYLQNNAVSFENKTQDNRNKSILGIGNIKLDFTPNKDAKIFYNLQYQLSNNNAINTLNSITNSSNSTFETISKTDNISVKQYVEWHNNYNAKHTTTFVVNHAYEKTTPEINWQTNQLFLAGLIPLQNDSNYNINQIKKIENNSIDALFKHYWIVNNFNHLYTVLGNNFGNSHYQTSEKQLLTNGTINDFSLNGFGNNVTYKLNDAYIGLEYKFKNGKWTNKPALYWHWYSLNVNQNISTSISKTLFQPQFNSEYEFNKSETLKFSYKLVNSFADAAQYANNYTLQSYNTVFKGDALLENERYHTASLFYSKMNMYRGVIWNGMASFNKKENTIRNQILISGISQYNTPVLTDNPETTWRVNCSVSKKIYRFNLKLNTTLGWMNYIQTLNNVTTSNERNNQSFGATFRTAYKKWPDISVGYIKSFNELNGITKSTYQSDEFVSSFEITLFKNFVYKIDYENLKNTNSNNQNNYYDIANTCLRFQKKNNPFTFEILVNNLFNNKIKNSYSISDYMISEQKTYVLPRVFMLSISYKL